MDTLALKDYVQEKITELDKNIDEREFALKGRLSFGMNKSHYGVLPSWQKFVKSKKRLLKIIWIETFSTILFISTFFFGIWDQSDQSWLRTIVVILGITLVLGGFFVAISFFTVANEVNRVQKNARRLIYEDFLYQISKKESELVP